MKNKIAIISGVIALAFIVAVFFIQKKLTIGSRPNIVLITLDTTRADFLSSYGSDEASTPNLDRAASRGVLFSNCTSAAYGTTPSHASIMTSTFARDHGVYNNATPLGEESVTIAETLNKEGYHTAAFVSALPVHEDLNFDQGFEVFDQNYQPPPGSPYERNAGMTTDSALKWIDKNYRNPLFLWIHYFDPHWPYSPPDEVLSKKINFKKELSNNGIKIDASQSGQYTDRGYMVIMVDDQLLALTKKDFNKLHRTLYAGEVEYMDKNIGRIMKWFENKNLISNTIFIFTGDHGETIDETNHEAHFTHMTVYQEVSRVPLIIMAPKTFTGGKKISSNVSTLDIVPTILDLLGVKPESEVKLRGVPLQKALEGKETERPVFLETSRMRGSGVISGRMKYLHITNPQDYFRHSHRNESEQLFDLDKDPAEQVNLMGSGIPSEKKMRAILKNWESQAEHARGAKRPRNKIKNKQFLDKLKNLGYIE